MNPVNRNRMLWLLAALVSVHMIVTTAFYLATATLPTALLVFTLAVFAVCAVAALYLMAHAPRRLRRADVRREVVAPAEEPVEEPVVRITVDEPKPRAVSEGA